ncbi:MAG: DUF2797 domain-containing protein [Halieaceae bacterium]|jgi:hypothetical protein|nr:DUF2797 domain-containing protein [Halieaceae bacterium]
MGEDNQEVKILACGAVRKMKTTLASPVQYHLVLGEHDIPMNQYLGKVLRLDYRGVINCVHCNRKTNKSFNQGYCYPCFKRLAQCDSCIMSPQKCHYWAGTCREPQWGEQNCMVDHYVYLANTSGLKVGITRGTQIPTRWIDQGASQAQPIFRVSNRLNSGLVEVVFKDHIADKTNWRKMLSGTAEAADLELARSRLMADCADQVAALRDQYGQRAITVLEAESETRITYPVASYPTKVSSFNLDKTGSAGGTLMGIKGQYLIFDTGVINIRKYGGYQLSLSVEG